MATCLPSDVLVNIFVRVNFPTSFTQTCRAFRRVAADTLARKRWLLFRYRRTSLAHQLLFRHAQLLLPTAPGSPAELLDWICQSHPSGPALQITPPSRFTLQTFFRALSISTTGNWVQSPFRIEWLASLPDGVRGRTAHALATTVLSLAHRIYGPDLGDVFSDDLHRFCSILQRNDPYTHDSGMRVRTDRSPFVWTLLVERDPIDEAQLAELRSLVLDARFAPTPLGLTSPVELSLLLWDAASLPDPCILSALIQNWCPTNLNTEHILSQGFIHWPEIPTFDHLATTLLSSLPVDATTFKSVFSTVAAQVGSVLASYPTSRVTTTFHPNPTAHNLFSALRTLASHASSSADLSFPDLCLAHVRKHGFTKGCIVETLSIAAHWDIVAAVPDAQLGTGMAVMVGTRIMDEMHSGAGAGDREMLRKALAFPFRFVPRHLPATHPLLPHTLTLLLRTATNCLVPFPLAPRRVTISASSGGENLAGCVHHYAKAGIVPPREEMEKLAAAVEQAGADAQTPGGLPRVAFKVLRSVEHVMRVKEKEALESEASGTEAAPPAYVQPHNREDVVESEDAFFSLLDDVEEAVAPAIAAASAATASVDMDDFEDGFLSLLDGPPSDTAAADSGWHETTELGYLALLDKADAALAGPSTVGGKPEDDEAREWWEGFSGMFEE
ncbi:hypothetical protein M427DRAFT_131659 [Gonapodya prolifera JEL478]|uniref:F-box domain-containing protein n=1 Tax=Gonapodya prolifera (strain JEL478) TaxID=1344416 RepID=A0A139AUC2_GONPJ|nr:hypothetical protein M427DRAFT_131659 [Gonapodya prolifera JEL478]|eukprot:KXS20318.1 hypothetical protein M427DRAFT_131659 [Gonapodya prolifera JEL478]